MKRLRVFLFLLALAVPPKFLLASEFSPPELVLVPKGSFEIGNKDFKNTKPVHKVILSNDYYIGKYEITNQQYADMLNYAWSKGYLDKEAFAEGSKKKEARGVTKVPQKYQDVFDEHSKLTFENGVFKPHPGKENFPVDEVTWYGAAFYCNMLSEKEGLTPLYNLDNWTCELYGKSGYRLPTEAEWEYVAKYDDGRKYPWGNQEPDDTYANIKKSIKAQADVLTTPVGAYSPKGDSKLGIADLAGNVAEWCNDWYDNSYRDKSYETDPKGPQAGLMVYAAPMKKYMAMKVVRGGSFLHDPKFREGMGVPFLIDSVTRAEAFTTSGRSFDCVNMSRQVEGFRVVKIVAMEEKKPEASAPAKLAGGKSAILKEKEVKYVAGKDNQWFTQDDPIYHYYSYTYDDRGRVAKKNTYKIGPDNLEFTADDELQEYQAYEYGPRGQLIKEVGFNGQGQETYYAVYEYNDRGNKVRMIRYAKDQGIQRYMTLEYSPENLVVKDVEYKGKGADGIWFSPDDEIEKYHKFEYDKDGRMLRAIEYHADHQGRGEDNVWFTDDDIIFATKAFFYNPDGSMSKENKFIASGPDNKWFTDDDILQYYSVYKYR